VRIKSFLDMSMIREKRKWQKFGYENEASDLRINEDFHFQEDGIDVLVPAPPAKFNKKPYTLYTKEDSEE